MKELPIACSLSAVDLEARRAELAEIGRRGLVSLTQASADRAVLDFNPDPRTKRDLERVVAAEAECCAFLEMNITEGDSLTLSIAGPPEAGALVEELARAIAGEVA
jgi:hypothetical protein